MLKKFQLSYFDHKELIKCCKQNSIKFLSSPFDQKSIDLLLTLKLKTLKIPSGEITNLPYLKVISKYNKPILLSTGMANLGEIEAALNVLLKSGIRKDKITTS